MNVRDIVLREKVIPMTEVISIIAFVCGQRKEQVLAEMTRGVGEKELLEIDKYLEERRAGKPLAYITQKKEFYSQDFFVDGNVLIPRPETEILVEEALMIIRREKRNITRILDMGTGSGAIGLTIARVTGKRIVCVDVSEKALRVVKKNARLQNVEEKIKIICSDLFGGIKNGATFDMILANLPYVAEEDWDSLMADVRDFEPRGALHGGKDGMDIYRRFFRELPFHMKEDGFLICEIGGARQANSVKNILEHSGFIVSIIKDYSGEERILTGSWKNLL